MNRKLRIFVIMACLGLIGWANQGQAQTAKALPNWDKWQFLLGEWVGEGGGDPGQASAGGFTFATDLQGAVLVRRNFAEYPASQDRPAFRHDDLMLIYPHSGATQADYFDNEGHVIRYNVYVSSGGDTLTFVSDPEPLKPRFRMSYFKAGADSVRIRFEIAPPGQPDQFRPYVEAAAHKK